MFGAPAPTPGFSSFGQPAPAAPFAQQPPAPAAPFIPPAGSIIPQAANEILTHQIQALENKRKEMEQLDVWRGKSAEDSGVTPASQPQMDGGFSTGISTNSQYSPYRPSPRSAAKIRPRGFGPAVSPTATTSTSPLSTIGNGGRPMMTPDAYAASSVKRLVIKPGAVTPKPKFRLRLTNGGPINEAQQQPPATDTTQITAPPPPVAAAAEVEQGSSPSPMKSPTPTGTPFSIPVLGRDTTPGSNPGTPASVRAKTNVGAGGKTMASLEKIAAPADPAFEYYQSVVGSPDGAPVPAPSPQPTQQSARKEPPSYVPKLTKPGYVMTPSPDQLASKSEADLASVTGFSIRHDPHGIVEWEGAVDVRNADLDSLVSIGQTDVSVYTLEEEKGCKPPVGEKLNRTATITFFNVYPKNGGADADEETKLKFAGRISRQTQKMKANLISYDKDAGVWKFQVQHF